jgi:hypothetical protein
VIGNQELLNRTIKEIKIIIKMKNILKAFIILIFSIQHAVGQNLNLRDSLTGKPISFANIVSNDGKLVGLSDINGIINKGKLLKSLKEGNNILTIQHLSYENYNISSIHLKSIDTLRINKRQNVLPEVIAIPEKNKTYDYTVLTGYYRCYQLEDSIAKYYKDGIIEFYLPRNGKNIKRIILNNRSFHNNELIAAQKVRKCMVNINGTVIPYLETGTVLDELGNQYTSKEYKGERLIVKSDSVIGVTSIDSLTGLININIDLIAPQKEETHSLFNYTSRITNINISENYLSGDISSISKSDLESRKEYRKLFFKHKKEKAETAIDIISELYIVDKKHVTKEEYNERKKASNQTSYSSIFTNEYWNDLTMHNIPQLNEPIKLLLDNKLIKE